VPAAFNDDQGDVAQAPAFTTETRSIRLSLGEPTDVKVTAWWAFGPPSSNPSALLGH
jgi:hypothetical protein